MYKLNKLKDKSNHNIAYKEARLKTSNKRSLQENIIFILIIIKKIHPECRMNGRTGSPSRPI
jgi:hypothetical protein